MSFNYTVGEGFVKAPAVSGKPIYRFTINGEVDFPVLTEIDSARFVRTAFTATHGNLTTTDSGDLTGSIYNIVVRSYDNGKGSQVTIVNHTFTMATRKLLTFLNPSVQQGLLTLEVQHVSGPILKNFTVTIE